MAALMSMSALNVYNSIEDSRQSIEDCYNASSERESKRARSGASKSKSKSKSGRDARSKRHMPPTFAELTRVNKTRKKARTRRRHWDPVNGIITVPRKGRASEREEDELASLIDRAWTFKDPEVARGAGGGMDTDMPVDAKETAESAGACDVDEDLARLMRRQLLAEDVAEHEDEGGGSEMQLDAEASMSAAMDMDEGGVGH